jgi:hypothetical protein
MAEHHGWNGSAAILGEGNHMQVEDRIEGSRMNHATILSSERHHLSVFSQWQAITGMACSVERNVAQQLEVWPVVKPRPGRHKL